MSGFAAPVQLQRKQNLLVIFLLISMLVVFAPVAHAEEDKFSSSALKLPADAYVSGWFINPGPLTIPAEPLKGGTPFLKTHLFPYKAYALDAALSVDGLKAPLDAGTELVGFISARPVACTWKNVGRSAGQAILLKSGTSHLCVLDSDGNGDFDKSFLIDVKHASLFRRQERIPADAKAIQPVKYREIDREKSSVGLNLFLFYHMHHSLVKEFSIGFQTEDGEELFLTSAGVTAYSFKDSQIPLSVKIMGGSYRIEEMIKGRIRIKPEAVQGLTSLHLGRNCCY